ncbi:MAG: hypothetical protein ACE5KG_00990 [Nitrososphaerales archaeon]
MKFPEAVDYHKPGNPKVPNAMGIFYSISSVINWFVLIFFGVEGQRPLALATSVLFGSNMGLFDDMVDLKWRYKAILPVFAALPFMVLRPSDRTTINFLFTGVLDLGELFFILLVPIFVTVVVNSYNQLGGLNGLEVIPGIIILLALALVSGNLVLLTIPIISLLVLGNFAVRGKAFIGNVGSFSIGITIAVYAVLLNLKFFVIIAMLPFFLNSVLILFSRFFLNQLPETGVRKDGLLYTMQVRSLGLYC